MTRAVPSWSLTISLTPLRNGLLLLTTTSHARSKLVRDAADYNARMSESGVVTLLSTNTATSLRLVAADRTPAARGFLKLASTTYRVPERTASLAFA
jgi:hypothetical protein